MPQQLNVAHDSGAQRASWGNPIGQRATQTAVLTIRNLPRQLRPTIESAMVVCIPSPSELDFSGQDPLTADWCTSWRRSPDNRRTVECREMITGTDRELGYLRAVLSGLAEEHDFEALVNRLV